MLGANDSITLKAIITIGLISGISVCTSAQSIIDWVIDPAGTATNYVIGEARKQANNAWEGFLDDNIKESLSEDAQKLANYSIDSTALDSIDKIFGMRTYGDGQFEEITKRQKQLIGSYLFCSNKMPIGLIGNGIIRKKIINKIESIQYPTHQITSIELLQYNHPEIAELRLLWNGTSIKDDAKVLYYWAVLANRLDSLYPKKISFPKPQQLSMNSAIDINGLVLKNDTAVSSAAGRYAAATTAFKELDLADFVDEVEVYADGNLVNKVNYTTKRSELNLSFDEAIKVAINKDVDISVKVSLKDFDDYGDGIRFVLEEDSDLKAVESKTSTVVKLQNTSTYAGREYIFKG